MGKHKRKFIDRKKDVTHTFKIVARSQRDPLVADETAPQSVLVDKDQGEINKAEQQSYGIYFDDDYDYLQHLRGVKEVIDWEETDVEVYTIRADEPKATKDNFKDAGLVLPSSVFESYVEEPLGMLNKAAPLTGPRPELDPEIVAELDNSDTDDCLNPSDENALPDDFVTLLNSEEPVHLEDGSDHWKKQDYRQADTNYSIFRFQQENLDDCDDDDEYERESINSDFNVSSDEERDELTSLHSGRCKTYKSQGTRSSFTEYSLSSSVIPRSELLSQLDDHFESKFLREYDDEFVGALDGEDIDGYIDEDSPAFTHAVERTKAQMKALKEDDLSRISQWIRDTEAMRRDDDKTEMVEVPVRLEEGEKWDCESILSTYSNLYNHPKCIKEILPGKSKILIDPKTGLPRMRPKSLTKRALAKLDDSAEDRSSRDVDTETLLTTLSAISIRPPGETPEERRTRKNALKELRRERRIEKKLNKVAFKEEKKIQERNNFNNRYAKKVVVS